MSIVVSGSVALDHIMVFPDRFKNHILPDKLHILNVSFNIETLKTHFGGVAGNIAYNLRLLGEDPYVLATVGSDFGDYSRWMEEHGIHQRGILLFEDVRTAQGFVTTDLDDNQIWAFYEGAMARAHESRVEDLGETPELAIVGPNGKQAMIDHARELKRRGVPTFVDPSHGLPLLDEAELSELVAGSAGYVVNDYELSLTLEQLGCSEDELAARTGALIVTRGEKGSTIRTGDDIHEIPPVRADVVVDPTGCGDAYRAGLLHGRARGLDWEVSGRIGSLMGAWQVQIEGTQNLKLGRDELRARYRSEFGSDL
jgi:adenosine kinase